MNDVIDAVMQARYRVATLSYEGTFKVIRHADVLQEHNQQSIARGLREGSISEDQVPRLTNIMLKDTERAFRVWQADGGRFRHESDGTTCTFDGEVVRHFESWDNGGHVIRMSRQHALTDLNTIDAFLEARGCLLEDFLAADDVHYEIGLSDRDFPGTTTVLHIRASKGDEPVLFTDVFLDTERDFWPLEIHSYTIWIEPDGSRTQYNDTKVVINDFHHIDGCFIPALLHKTRYLSVVRDGADVELAGIEETLNITSVEVNQPIDDQMFTIEFPAGSQFLDSDDGLTYIVDADGTVAEFSEQITAPGRTDAPGRSLLVIINLLAFVVIALWIVWRQLR